jgi:UDP-N-acetylglucosamine:LPS N-acetylglucosamine transferase
VKNFGIADPYIHYVGFPVRKAFLKRHTPTQKTKKDFGIPENVPVLLIMMGAQGSQELYFLAKHLEELTFPVHVIFIAGKMKLLKYINNWF